MQEEELLLVSLLEEQILKLQSKLDQKEKENSLTSSSQRELINQLKKDKNTIMNIDINEIEKIINELTDKEESKLINHLEVIKILLSLNKEKHTTYKITESQLDYINQFMKLIEEKEKKSQEEIERILKDKKNYHQLLKKIMKNEEPITELNILNHLFKDLNITEDTQSRILIGLMKYNKRISSPQTFLIPEWET